MISADFETKRNEIQEKYELIQKEIGKNLDVYRKELDRSLYGSFILEVYDKSNFSDLIPQFFSVEEGDIFYEGGGLEQNPGVPEGLMGKRFMIQKLGEDSVVLTVYDSNQSGVNRELRYGEEIHIYSLEPVMGAHPAMQKAYRVTFLKNPEDISN